jgi:hypothetical protein
VRPALVALALLLLLGGSAGAVPARERLLVVLVTWGPQPVARADAQAAAAEAERFLAGASFGELRLETAVTPWLNGLARQPQGCDLAMIGARARSAAVRAGSDPARFDRLAFVFPEIDCPWGGAYFDNHVWANGRFDRALLAHELGHIYGIQEEGPSARCTPSRCTPALYGNPYGVMGHGWSDYTAFEKWTFGWLDDVIGPSPRREVALGAIDRSAAAPRALRVHTSSDEYWFEFRPPEPRWDPRTADAVPGVAVVGSPSQVPEGRSRFPLRDLLVLDPGGSGQPALQEGEAITVAGTFRLAVTTLAAEQALVRFEWLDRRAPSTPRVRARQSGRRVVVSWSPARDAGSGVERYRLLVDGRPARTIAAVRSLGRVDVPADLSVSLALAAGRHSVAVRAVDRAGNEGAAAAATVVRK